MGLADNIIGVESGGNPNAANPNSSAAGPGQFIDATWLSMMNKYRPDLAQSMSQDDLLALKTNPALAKQMTDAYANENAGVLKANGFDASPGNVYLAHFAGPAGATSILGSDPSTPIESVLGQGAVSANPFLRGKTAGDVVNWAAGKMGSQAPQMASGKPPGLLAPSEPSKQNGSQDLLGGLLAQRQPGQPQTTQDDGPQGLLQVAALKPVNARPQRNPFAIRRYG